MLLKLARGLWLQDIFISLSTAIHPAIKHNIGKIEILKSALWYAAFEEVSGGYFEFGVYEGTSMLSAVKIYKRILAKESLKLLGTPIKRQFYGFDSFEGGFRYHTDLEAHPVFKEGEFVSCYERCQSRLKKHAEVSLIKGYFEDTVRDRTPPQVPMDEKCAVALIDCDLKEPAAIALEFLAPRLQPGSVIILDDVFSYKGNPALGVSGAWVEFLARHPEILVKEFFNYGLSGKSYIVYRAGPITAS